MIRDMRLVIRKNMADLSGETWRVIWKRKGSVKILILTQEQIDRLRERPWKENYEWDIW